MPENNRKSHPGLAAVFSFIFNGLGQIYNGQISKGLTIVFFSTLSLLIFVIGSGIIASWLLGKIFSLRILMAGCGLFVGGLILICFLSIYSIFDAYRVASSK
jgi:TM2 domain-containing membrane protein YozV